MLAPADATLAFLRLPLQEVYVDDSVLPLLPPSLRSFIEGRGGKGGGGPAGGGGQVGGAPAPPGLAQPQRA